MIELHSKPTPNGQKVMIMLEETGLEWKHIDVDISIGEQFTADYLKLSPNNKIPAIIDTEGPGGRYTMMESGAILIYLAEKTGKFLPKDARKRYDTLQWLIFQMAHVGPMFGQSGHFNNQAKGPELQYGSTRATATTTRPCASTACWKTACATANGWAATNTPLPTWRSIPGHGATRTAASTRPAFRISCAGSRPWKRDPRYSGTRPWPMKSVGAWRRPPRESNP